MKAVSALYFSVLCCLLSDGFERSYQRLVLIQIQSAFCPNATESNLSSARKKTATLFLYKIYFNFNFQNILF